MLEEAIVRLKEGYAKLNDEKMNTQLEIFLATNVPRIKETLSN